MHSVCCGTVWDLQSNRNELILGQSHRGWRQMTAIRVSNHLLAWSSVDVVQRDPCVPARLVSLQDTDEHFILHAV